MVARGGRVSGWLALVRHAGVRRLIAVTLDCVCTFLDEDEEDHAGRHRGTGA